MMENSDTVDNYTIHIDLNCRQTGGQADRRTGGQADRRTGGQADMPDSLKYVMHNPTNLQIIDMTHSVMACRIKSPKFKINTKAHESSRAVPAYHVMCIVSSLRRRCGGSYPTA